MIYIIDHNDTTRTVATYDETGAITSTRPYTAAERASADAALSQNATLTDLTARIERIEARLWPPDPDPEPGEAPTAPTWAERGGVWPHDTLVSDGGKVWRNTAGVPLTTAPSDFPGSPNQWGHLFIEVVATPPVEPPAAPWSKDATYKIGDRVTHNGKRWECLLAHGPERQGTWAPGPATPTIWRDLGPA